MMKLVTQISFIMLLLLFFGLDYVNAEPGVESLRAIRGRTARLPCGNGKVYLDGPDAYVLWIKDDTKLVHSNRSYDFMGCVSDEGTGCGDNTTFVIKSVQDSDVGFYRCRVHYQGSPAQDFVIHVFLIDSPGIPRIYSEDDEEIVKGFLGPLNLGSGFNLLCEIELDNVPGISEYTTLYWRRNGEVMESSVSTDVRTMRAYFAATNITRDELDAHYECVAENAQVTEPLIRSIVIKMYLPPLKVEIRLNDNVNFEAGQPRLVDCIIIGCVPPPAVTWHLEQLTLNPTSHREIHEGNYTVSTLSLSPSIGIFTRKLRCRAHNPHLPKHMFQDTLNVHIGHRPVCAAGITVIPRTDDSGTSETVVCQVEAMPEPLQFIWTLPDSRTLVTAVKPVEGIPHLFTSTLTWLPHRKNYGVITCHAYNIIGEQIVPCEYAMAQNTPPNTPHCELKDAQKEVSVHCEGEWSIGNPQVIVLEVVNANNEVVYNESNNFGEFHLTSLPDNLQNLSVKVYAENLKGVSSAIYLSLGHLREAGGLVETTLDPNKVITRHYVWGTMMGVTSVAFVALALMCAVKHKRQPSFPSTPDLVPSPDGSFHREPELERHERVVAPTTNITINELVTCQDRFSSSPVFCRVRIGCNGHEENCCQSLAAKEKPQAYYV